MNIINFILFQTAWFVTIFSAANGKPYFGVLFTALWMLFHLFFVVSKRKNELMLIVSTILIATIFELTLVMNGFVSYPSHSALLTLVPIWMITLWVNLAATINYSMTWLKQRYFLSAVLAAVAGPLTYFAGERFGAIELNGTASLIAISIMWLISMPLLFWLSHFYANIKFTTKQMLTSGTD